ncbi:hemolysin secretion protein D [Spirochaetia bacterium]|nr:hemolysin secretion protein D [Spirochaetia bacterium]
MKTSFTFMILAAAVFAGPLCLTGCSPKGGAKAGVGVYDFTTITRGTLEKTVSSSGSLKPVSTVKVLPRMSGKVEKINVDYNDIVRRGDVIAELNTDMLRLQREQQLAQVIKSRANYELQLVNYRNQEALAEKKLISEYELKTGKTTLDIQAAELSASEASLRVIETEINQYAFITSPIDGIVLERNISVGDTVVDSSNSNSTSIFTLAENLEEMQIEAAVGELDIASIHKGQSVRFTLESLPGRNFTGVVEMLRMVPTVQNNVVSYTVIINVENRDGTLLPGMTCAVDFIVERRENILMAPNAALRYQPTGLGAAEIAEMVFNAGLKNMDEDQRKAAIEARAQTKTTLASVPQAQTGTGIAGLVGGGGTGGPPMGGPGGGRVMPSGSQGGGRPAAAGNTVVMRNLWYLNGEGKLEVMRVQAGISNGTSTEIRSTEDLEKIQIILREKI